MSKFGKFCAFFQIQVWGGFKVLRNLKQAKQHDRPYGDRISDSMGLEAANITVRDQAPLPRIESRRLGGLSVQCWSFPVVVCTDTDFAASYVMWQHMSKSHFY